MFEVKVAKDKCKGCKLCIEVCPEGVFSISSDFNKLGAHYAVVENVEKCNGCKRCVIICSDVAIEIYLKKEEVKNENRSNT